MGSEVDLERLAALPMMKTLPEETRRRVGELLLELSDRDKLEDGEALVQEGYLAFESGYVVLEGTVIVEKEGMPSIKVPAPALLGEMSQFSAGDTRTATVRAAGPITVLFFHWEEFYDAAKEALSEEEELLLRHAMERLVWERFGKQALTDLPLFKGLEDGLKFQVCLIFSWLTKREVVPAGETLFTEKERCKAKGFLLTKGKVQLMRGIVGQQTVEAPNILGVMPKHDPERVWTASGVAETEVEVLRFSWQEYIAQLEQRLSREDQRKLVDAMKANAKAHFWH